ncbi:unnamed protein product [Nezara viridula]|uniref:Uncharacterized protein n=1 Tax=Nezara viridula TaxID=85310 RepID=A0A9P0E580_NEZVI|nr:unnamed protein product [Nezara viridula]
MNSTDIPSYRDLINFVTERSRVLDMMAQEGQSGKSNTLGKSCFKKYTKQNSCLKKEQIPSSIFSIAPLNFGGSNETDAADDEANRNPQSDQMKSESVGFGKRLLTLTKVEMFQKINSQVYQKLTCWNCAGRHVYTRCSLLRKLFCCCGIPGVFIHFCPKCTSENGQGNRTTGNPFAETALHGLPIRERLQK